MRTSRGAADQHRGAVERAGERHRPVGGAANVRCRVGSVAGAVALAARGGCRQRRRDRRARRPRPAPAPLMPLPSTLVSICFSPFVLGGRSSSAHDRLCMSENARRAEGSRKTTVKAARDDLRAVQLRGAECAYTPRRGRRSCRSSSSRTRARSRRALRRARVSRLRADRRRLGRGRPAPRARRPLRARRCSTSCCRA